MAHKYSHLAMTKLKIPTFDDAGGRRANDSADFKIRYEGEEKRNDLKEKRKKWVLRYKGNRQDGGKK